MTNVCPCGEKEILLLMNRLLSASTYSVSPHNFSYFSFFFREDRLVRGKKHFDGIILERIGVQKVKKSGVFFFKKKCLLCS